MSSKFHCFIYLVANFFSNHSSVLVPVSSLPQSQMTKPLADGVHFGLSVHTLSVLTTATQNVLHTKGR